MVEQDHSLHHEPGSKKEEKKRKGRGEAHIPLQGQIPNDGRPSHKAPLFKDSITYQECHPLTHGLWGTMKIQTPIAGWGSETAPGDLFSVAIPARYQASCPSQPDDFTSSPGETTLQKSLTHPKSSHRALQTLFSCLKM